MHREMKAKGKRQKAKEGRGEESEGVSVSPSSRPAATASRRTSSHRTPKRSKSTASTRTPTRRAISVVMVGAGRLGTALARALGACGYDVRALVARSLSSARRAGVRAGVNARALSIARLEELPPSDILFITTPDDAVAETAGRLASLAVEGRGRVALHTSGALSSDALAPLAAHGYGVGSMHPLAAVSDAVLGAESLRRAFYCVEGDASAVRVARRAVRDLGGRSFSVRTEDKALYHAAAVLTAGHTVALFDIASGLLARCGLADREARRVLLPLLASAVENLARETPERALTGTFARGDAETVRRHLTALRDAGEADALLAYALLGGRSLRLAARAGADAKRLQEIARLLAEEIGLGEE